MEFFTPQWPEISAYQREAQLKTQALVSNSAMAVTLDVGTEFQIHSPYKKEVGQRLAFWRWLKPMERLVLNVKVPNMIVWK